MKLNRIEYQGFPNHLVSPSPWPLLVSFSLLILTLSAVIYFNGYQGPLGIDNIYLLSLGLITTLIGISLWFRDIITEGTYLGDHTSYVQKGITLGVVLFIVSEIFFFISIFWSFFHSSLSPTVELGNNWPPMGIQAIDPFGLPLLNTALLLSSGATVTYAHHALIKAQKSAAIYGLIITIILALVFTACQAIEYKYAGFTLSDSVFGTTFYFSTGFHGFHVLVGTMFLLVGLVRIIQNHFTSYHHLGFEAAILYWHFVDYFKTKFSRS